MYKYSLIDPKKNGNKNKRWFELLFIREEAKNLFLRLHKEISNNWNKDYFFKDQILRASLSISNNIAEWYERKWNKEFIRFLNIANWSAWETRNMLIIWKELNIFNENEFNKNLESVNKISGWIYKLIKNKTEKI